MVLSGIRGRGFWTRPRADDVQRRYGVIRTCKRSSRQSVKTANRLDTGEMDLFVVRQARRFFVRFPGSQAAQARLRRRLSTMLILSGEPPAG
jgi:hypothetical protein